MTSEELNKALYDKMSAEMAGYREWLMTQPPEEILKNAYEYAMREDILLWLENNDLNDEQARALLNTKSPLYNAFNAYEKIQTGHMNFIQESVERTADEAVREERDRQQQEWKETPLYPFPGSFARQHGELDQYRASRNANIACRDAVDAAIREHYRDFSVNTAAVREIINNFGYGRTLYVLANTVRQKKWDERFSADNRRWAMSIPVSEDPDGMDGDKNSDFVLQSHSVKVDAFIVEARHEYLLSLPLSKAEIAEEAQRIFDALKAVREPNSPHGTHFMAEISPDFLRRASDQDRDALMRLLPFDTLSVSLLEGRSGTYALISKDEDRASKKIPQQPGRNRRKKPER